MKDRNRIKGILRHPKDFDKAEVKEMLINQSTRVFKSLLENNPNLYVLSEAEVDGRIETYMDIVVATCKHSTLDSIVPPSYNKFQLFIKKVFRV